MSREGWGSSVLIQTCFSFLFVNSVKILWRVYLVLESNIFVFFLHIPFLLVVSNNFFHLCISWPPCIHHPFLSPHPLPHLHYLKLHFIIFMYLFRLSPVLLNHNSFPRCTLTWYRCLPPPPHPLGRRSYNALLSLHHLVHGAVHVAPHARVFVHVLGRVLLPDEWSVRLWALAYGVLREDRETWALQEGWDTMPFTSLPLLNYKYHKFSMYEL